MSEAVEAPRRWASSSRERLDGFVMVWLVAACCGFGSRSSRVVVWSSCYSVYLVGVAPNFT